MKDPVLDRTTVSSFFRPKHQVFFMKIFGEIKVSHEICISYHIKNKSYELICIFLTA